MKQAASIAYNPEFTSGRDRLRWVENASRGLRVVGPAHDVTRLGHNGWFLDPLGDGDTVYGVVLQLPGRSGFARFVPAISDPWNPDCYCVDFRDRYDGPGNDADDAKRDCARAADQLAEAYAEREREYQIREIARLRIAEEREAIRENCATFRRLVYGLRTAGHALPPSVREVVRLRLRDLRKATARAVATVRKLTDDPYSWTY